MTDPTHTNRLIHETSPYLLQHAHNPVDWYPWGEEAKAKAAAENKPIFLSIGYSACHWCHVMERESFENEATAARMNELFVNIKVDREERPDLDAIYMDAVQAMTGQGGWPMSVFLTPDGRPFYGGTYFPPEPRYGMPSFPQLLQSVANAYATDRERVIGQADRLTEMLSRTAMLEARSQDLSTATLDQAVETLAQHFDNEEGGFGSQPKFPQPMTLDFLMTQHARTGNEDALYMAELTLFKMAHGGIYDQLGGGFHRYSVDRFWLVPHFEKMLYDNAQLLRTYLHAWQITERPLYQRMVEETVAYVLREMTAPTGGFYSTQDADSEGEEGKFFVWTPAEIQAVLGPRMAAIFEDYYDVSQRGNFEGGSILNVVKTVEEVADRFQVNKGDVEQALAIGRATLFDLREERIKPARDEKILTEWNGLMIQALADCGVTFNLPDALDAAQQAADFILARMRQADGRLYRSYKDGQARFNAYLEDYAALINGLLALYRATFELRWLGEAQALLDILYAEFHDPERGGFYQTGQGHEALVVRRKEFIDNALPSGNSLAAEALLQMHGLLGNPRHREEAGRIFLLMEAAMASQPTGFGRLLCDLDRYLAPSQEIALVGELGDAATQMLLQPLRRRYLPHAVIAQAGPAADTPLPIFEGRGLVDGKPAAYVCENFACRRPVTTAEELLGLLKHTP
ncbi:MAG: thioredoxin domain-containing protein [Caldilineaceae bacterium]|nr:thioredoxin domain-containing protein [Caldilineaceae bacterium]